MSGPPPKMPAAPQPKMTYQDLVEGVRLAYPDTFDMEDPYELAEAVMEVYPEFRQQVDPVTKGTELLSLTSKDFERDTKTGKLLTDARGRYMQRKKPLETVANPNRPGLLSMDTAISTGLRVVPSLVGGVVGTAVAGPGPGTVGGGMVGAGLGETAAQFYERGVGISEEISPTNIAAQTALGGIPIASRAGKFLGSKLGGMVAEGVVQGTGSTALEVGLEQGRLPSVPELGASALFGGAFGGAVGAGQALGGLRREAKATDIVGKIGPLLDQAGMQHLPVEARAAVSQQVVTALEQAAQLDPVVAQAGYSRLMAMLEGQRQQDLQVRATAFLQAWGEQAPRMDEATRFDMAKKFLDGLKSDNMTAEAFNQLVNTVAGIDTLARSAPPARLMLPAIGETSTSAIPLPSRFGDLSMPPAAPARADLLPPPPTLPPFDLEAPVAPRTTAGVGRIPAATEPSPPPVDIAAAGPAEGWAAYWGGTMDEAQRGAFEKSLAADRARQLAGAKPAQLPGVPEMSRWTPGQPVVDDAALALQPYDRPGRTVIYNEMLNAARRVDPNLDERAFRQEFDSRLDMWDALDTDDISSDKDIAYDPRALLKEIAKRGGIFEKSDRQGPIRWGVPKMPSRNTVREAGEIKRLKEGGKNRHGRWQGISGVFRRSGMSLDEMATSLRDDPRFAAIAGPNELWAALDEISVNGLDAMEARRAGTAGPPALSPEALGSLGMNPAKPWWKPVPAAEHKIDQYLRTLNDDQLQDLYHDLAIHSGVDQAPEYRAYVAQALEQRGLKTPEQADLLVGDYGRPLGPAPEVPPQSLMDLPGLPGADAGVPPATGPEPFSGETGAVGKVKRGGAPPALAPRRLQIDEDTLKQFRTALEKNGDEEMAGLVLGTPDGQIRRVIVSRNVAADPTTQFEIAPQSIASAQIKAKAMGLEVLGSFHSQPTGSAEPSRADLKGGVADLPMVIAGVKGGELRDVRVWQPQGAGKRAKFEEGELLLGDAASTTTPFPGKARAVRQAINKIPVFKGAVGDAPALEKYLSDFESELGTEPFFLKAQEAMRAGNPAQAWMELQTAQILYGRVARGAIADMQAGANPQTAAGRKKLGQAASLKDRVENLEAGSPQSAAGQLWALYDGRTQWVEGVGRVVVPPSIPPTLQGKGVTAGEAGILRPPGKDAVAALPAQATRERIILSTVNNLLGDVEPGEILDNPTKQASTRLFRQIGEQMMLHPSRFKAMKALGVEPEQVAAHFEADVTQAAKMLAALSAWKRENALEIKRIEGIRGASGDLDDIVIYGKGGVVGKLSDLTSKNTVSALLPGGNAWDRAILLQQLTRGQVGVFDQFGRATTGFMLSQHATAMRNLHSATGRWGTSLFDDAFEALAHTATLQPKKAGSAFKRVADMARYAPILRPSGWVMPWQARNLTLEKIFDFSGGLLQFAPAERKNLIRALSESPDHAVRFVGDTMFGEGAVAQQSKSKILDYFASPKVQATLTALNRMQEFTVRPAILHVSMKDQLRQAGFNPEKILALPNSELIKAAVGAEKWTQMLDQAVGEALDFTFAAPPQRRGPGKTGKGQTIAPLNSQLIDLVNRFPAIREGYKFAKFNMSAAPRFIWDHSGVGLLLEPLMSKVLHRGRYHLGKTATTFRETLIPEYDQKIVTARRDMTEALNGVMALKDEIGARRRLQTKYDKLGVAQQQLPGMLDKIQQNRQRLGMLEQARSQAMGRYQEADSAVKELQRQRAPLADIVEEAAKVNAPDDFKQLAARNLTGALVLLPAAVALRAQQREEGTPWYKLKVAEGVTLDTRPLAPFTQYLFAADVLLDYYHETDWAGVMEDMDKGLYTWDTIHKAFYENGRYGGDIGLDDAAKGILAAAALPFEAILKSGAIYDRYEGKYTNQTLGQEAGKAFLSISQAAGTTLALTEYFGNITERGFSVTDAANLAINTVGQFLARTTIPLAQFKAVSDLYDDDESHARIAETGEDLSLAPLGQVLGNIPFIGAATIPDTYNQLTGAPLDTFLPLTRALGGVTLQKWERIPGEVAAIGLPGTQVYIRKTGDVYLDRLIGFHYSQIVSQYLPEVLDSEEYQALGSPALKRDVLSKVFSNMKRAAVGTAAADAGAAFIESKDTGETRRRRLRREKVQRLMEQENLIVTEVESEPQVIEPEEPEPEVEFLEPEP